MKTKITTSDIYFAAALLTTGARIDKENIDRTDPRHIRFTVNLITPLTEFENSITSDTKSGSVSSRLSGLEFYEDLWDSGKMMVNALSYKTALQQIKSLIHST